MKKDRNLKRLCQNKCSDVITPLTKHLQTVASNRKNIKINKVNAQREDPP